MRNAAPVGPVTPPSLPASGLGLLGLAERAALATRVFAGPDPERDGVSAWTRAGLCNWLQARFGKVFHPSSLSRVLKRLDLSRPKTRPRHPEADLKAQESFRKRGCATRWGRRPQPIRASGSRSGSWMLGRGASKG